MLFRRFSAFVASLPVPRRALTRGQLSSRPPSRFYTRRMPLATMADVRSAPGVLDTDASGGVLMAPRFGTVQIGFAPSLQEFQGEILVLGVWANEDDEAEFVLPDSLQSLNGDGVLDELVVDAEFKGKSGSSTEMVRMNGNGVKRVVLYGLGKKSKGSSAVSGATRFAVQKGMAIKNCKAVGVFVDGMDTDGVAAAAEGAHVGAYVDERYKEKKEAEKIPEKVVLVDVKGEGVEQAVKRGTAIATGIITTKEVVAAPANALTPETLATAAEMVAKEVGLDIKVMGRKECEDLGMGLYLGVGRGSTDEPKFIHMTYKGEGEIKKKICLVGKAVTFDTGGTNLKAGAGSMIEMMKFDMGGSAVCLGTAKVIGQLKPKGIEVHFIMPAVENMIGDRAIHPGDILKASNGKTVEVINTDAEGRLCLADALVFAENLGEVDYVVDMATLTGAILVSLGNEVAGMWSSSDELAEALLESSKSAGENMWRMPLVDEYVEQLKSKIADLRNIGMGRSAGSIVAALFLREFVKTKNWAHLDIAGTVWSDKRGPTAWGVKTMTHWLESHASK